MRNILIILILSVSVSGCKMSPYGNEFDCQIPQGLSCKSLYEVSKLADSGIFEPDNPNYQEYLQNNICTSKCQKASRKRK